LRGRVAAPRCGLLCELLTSKPTTSAAAAKQAEMTVITLRCRRPPMPMP
jgi:hypothetical protein